MNIRIALAGMIVLAPISLLLWGHASAGPEGSGDILERPLETLSAGNTKL